VHALDRVEVELGKDACGFEACFRDDFIRGRGSVRRVMSDVRLEIVNVSGVPVMLMTTCRMSTSLPCNCCRMALLARVLHLLRKSCAVSDMLSSVHNFHSLI
jgi:hypothetical protein